MMDKTMFDKGMKIRREVLGDAAFPAAMPAFAIKQL